MTKLIAISCSVLAVVLSGGSHASGAAPNRIDGEKNGANHRLWSDAPVIFPENIANNMRYSARHWSSHVFPLGNGRLGCTVFGDPVRERVAFNEDSLWIGSEKEMGGYQPFGDVYIDLGHEDVSHYRRELDMRRGLHRVAYTHAGVTYQREVFASHPAQVIVMRFTADKPGMLSGKVSMGNHHERPVIATENTLSFKGRSSQLYFWDVLKRKAEKRGVVLSDDQLVDLDFEALVRVSHEGGSLTTESNAVTFAGCNALTLYLAADTSYIAKRDQQWQADGLHARLISQLDAAEAREYDALRDEHVEDFSARYDRCSIDLGPTPDEVNVLPTADRLDRYRKQFEDLGRADDRGLEALLYHFARYFMLSCSRPGHGALPANLQGLWIFKLFPAWRCDYHTDVNLQMNYWFVDQANLSECFRPLAEWVTSTAPVRREATKKEFGVRGWAFRSMNNVFGGDAYHYVPGDAAWLAQNLWDHYAFTLDEAYLRDYAYPIMKELCWYWEDSLVERSVTNKLGKVEQRLLSPKAQSPEHGPFAEGNSYDMQLCYNLFGNYIEASQVLDVDAEYRATIADMRSRLLEPQIGRWGQLQEWAADIDDPKDTHRHLSHLIAVHPGLQISPVTTPALAEAAKVSMNARGDGRTGWSKAWKIAIWARLHDGERAYKLASEFMRNNVYGNLWGYHPPFQIDGNFGYAAGIHEMLVQSHMGMIHLLPSLPTAWPDGTVKGMRVRGGFEVDFAWKDGTLEKALIRNISNPGETCLVRYGESTVTVHVPHDKEVVVDFTHKGK